MGNTCDCNFSCGRGNFHSGNEKYNINVDLIGLQIKDAQGQRCTKDNRRSNGRLQTHCKRISNPDYDIEQVGNEPSVPTFNIRNDIDELSPTHA